MSKILSLILIAFAISASARNFHIHNNCATTESPSPVPPLVDQAQSTAARQVSVLSQSVDIGANDNWAGNFNCGGPSSLAEFSLTGWNGQDFYDISLVDGFSLAIQISPNSGCPTLTCHGKPCAQGYNFWNDDKKTTGCNGRPNYTITYCP